jgi:hypothetical protein
MKRLFARSRSLVLVVVLTVVAALCAVSTASAVSSASTAPDEPAASSAQCNFVESLQTCKSTDHTVAYSDSVYGDTSQCTFVFYITWGDGGSTTRTVTDPTVGHHLVAEHIYAAPGVYTITVTPQVTVGTCTATSSVHTFTLTNPPPSPTIYWSRTSGRPGTHVTMTGNGWVPGGTVHVQLPSKEFFIGKSSWKVDSHGGWQQRLTVADTTQGTYKLSFSETSGNLLVTGSFRVLPIKASTRVYCLGGSPGQACTGGSTSGGKPTTITVPKVPSEPAKTLSPAKLTAATELVRSILSIIAIIEHIPGETLPAYDVKALTCSGLSGADFLQCVQNTGFPQAPITKG